MSHTLEIKNAKIAVYTRASGSVRLVLYHGGLPQAIEMTRAEADSLGRALLIGEIKAPVCPVEPLTASQILEDRQDAAGMGRPSPGEGT